MRQERTSGVQRLVLLGVVVAFLLAAKPVRAENIDLIVMVETSASMFPYFDDLMNYLIHDLLATRLHRGDTFHLLSFDATPEVEIALEMTSAEATDRAYGRILLLHPLGRYSDLVAALQFLYTYAKELPEANPKEIILITDGVHDPPPESPNKLSDESVRSEVNDIGAAMKKERWKFDILKVPPESAAGEEGKKSYLPDLAQSLGVPIVPFNTQQKQAVTGMTTGFPTLIFPPALGKVGNRFVAPFRVKNWKSEPIIVKLSGVQSDGTELLDGKVSVTVPPNAEAALEVPIRLPLSYPPGDHAANVQLVFEDDLRISPTSGTLSFIYTGKGGLPFPRLTFLYAIYIVLALALLYVLIRFFIFLRRKMQEVPVTGFAKTRVSPAEPPAFSRKRLRPTVTSLKRSLPRSEIQQGTLAPLIEMRVGLQNPHIGFRNVHRIPAGGRRSIGGGFSSYLIFLVRVPPFIAEIANKGGRYIFTPRRPEMFPGISGPIEDCLDVEIPFVDPHGRQMSLHFRQWVSPLDEINRIMRSVRHDG